MKINCISYTHIYTYWLFALEILLIKEQTLSYNRHFFAPSKAIAHLLKNYLFPNSIYLYKRDIYFLLIYSQDRYKRKDNGLIITEAITFEKLLMKK
jgi:hypothetical protein